jgi:tRNA dimethylallyltransferase
MKPKIIVILGPTASGKSSLAVYLSQKWNGEIISADSRQVYRGMNLGTGKITKKEMGGVPHHLIDIISPKKQFSVAEYKKLGQKAINSITTKGKIPFICGGTGLYIDTLLGKISLPEVPPNPKLRKTLDKKTTSELFGILKKLDANRAKKIDKYNRVRIIRSIEIAKRLGQVPPLWKKNTPYDVLYIGLYPKDLETRIKKRLLKRIHQGMIAEVRNLHKNGLSWKRMEALGLEYRFVSRYLRNQISKEKMLRELTGEIIKYAKRQMTWFKANDKIAWFDPKARDYDKQINHLVAKFL